MLIQTDEITFCKEHGTSIIIYELTVKENGCPICKEIEMLEDKIRDLEFEINDLVEQF